MGTKRAGWPKKLASAVAATLVALVLWTLIGLPGGAANRDSQKPKVRRVLEGLDRSEPPSKEGGGEADSLRAGGGRAHRKIVFEIPRSRYLPIGRVRIPEIGLDTAFRDGVFDEILTHGPGHWPGTPVPGEEGNSVLSGHRTTYTHPFGDLDLLDRGDKVMTSLGGQDAVTYRVYKTSIVPEESYVDFVLRQPDRARARTLTMFACHPKGYRTNRIVVQARARPRGKNEKSSA